MPDCIILSGIPASGKSSWATAFQARESLLYDLQYRILSRDYLRVERFGYTYKQNSKDEVTVTEDFWKYFNLWTALGYDLIIDNTNCKQSYITEIILKLPDYYGCEIKFFPIPLWKAQLRNLLRGWKTGKKIPWKVMKAMHKNFKKLYNAHNR